jgi:hypothetical protein
MVDRPCTGESMDQPMHAPKRRASTYLVVRTAGVGHARAVDLMARRHSVVASPKMSVVAGKIVPCCTATTLCRGRNQNRMAR